ncbi:MAG: flagellar basal-body rod protein FlgF [Rhizomicrobium sp.]|jgi:flagellar basal-body rod protein FlgF
MDNTQLVNLSYQLAAYRSMDVIANNLANVSTPGFKRESTKFEEYISQNDPVEGDPSQQSLSFVQDGGTTRDLSQGNVVKTGGQFDLAIGGSGYFPVQTASGAVRYTRDGHFTLDPSGKIVDSNGDSLQGDGGDITVSTEDGDIHIGKDGVVTGAKGQLGQVKVVNFANERALVQEGQNLYSTTQTANTVTTPDIQQGMLESSNVSPVVEISKMLEVMRSYQATATLSQSQQQMKNNALDKLSAVQS